jgi:hypothetical protein
MAGTGSTRREFSARPSEANRAGSSSCSTTRQAFARASSASSAKSSDATSRSVRAGRPEASASQGHAQVRFRSGASAELGRKWPSCRISPARLLRLKPPKTATAEANGGPQLARTGSWSFKRPKESAVDRARRASRGGAGRRRSVSCSAQIAQSFRDRADAPGPPSGKHDGMSRQRLIADLAALVGIPAGGMTDADVQIERVATSGL